MVSTNRFSHLACIVTMYLLADFSCVQGMSYRKAMYRHAATRSAYSPPADESEGETNPLEKILRYFLNSQGSDELQRRSEPWMGSRLPGQLPAQFVSQLAQLMQDPVYGPLLQMYLARMMSPENTMRMLSSV